MPITRRQFVAATGSALALTVLGCGRSESDREEAHLATAPFLAGPVSRFAAPGVYTDAAAQHDVYLVSDGRTLTALAAVCTHRSCAVHWHTDGGEFRCPCHQSTFDRAGVNMPDAKAKRPLDRCAIALVSDGEVRVDPTRLFRADRNEWDAPDCVITLDEQGYQR